MHSGQLQKYIINPALEAIGLYTPEASILLLATAAQESNCGMYIKQIKGPALGIFQMEPDTHSDLYINFLDFKPSLKDRLKPLLLPFWNRLDQLVVNPVYAAAMCRMHYYRFPEALPEVDRDLMWEYYKEYYNTILGAATKEEWDKNWDYYVASVL